MAGEWPAAGRRGLVMGSLPWLMGSLPWRVRGVAGSGSSRLLRLLVDGLTRARTGRAHQHQQGMRGTRDGLLGGDLEIGRAACRARGEGAAGAVGVRSDVKVWRRGGVDIA